MRLFEKVIQTDQLRSYHKFYLKFYGRRVMALNNSFSYLVVTIAVLISREVQADVTLSVAQQSNPKEITCEGPKESALENYVPHRSSSTFALEGNTDLGYYYVTFSFGTPPQRQTLIVDTGSSKTIVPCKGRE